MPHRWRVCLFLAAAVSLAMSGRDAAGQAKLKDKSSRAATGSTREPHPR